MSTGLDEAKRKLQTASSDLQYAVLFAPRGERVALGALLAIYVELREVLRECSDATVARSKLDWWQHELELLAQHRPEHPLCQLLNENLQGRSLPIQTLFEITASVVTDIRAVAFQSFEQVEQYCRQRGGALTELAAEIGAAQNNVTLQAARMLGQCWQLADVVLHGADYAAHGRNYFAADDLARHAVKLPLAAGTPFEPGLQALLRDYSSRAQALRANALALPSSRREALACGLVLSGLACAKLQRYAGAEYQSTEPRGFNQLWTAWRSARQAR